MKIVRELLKQEQRSQAWLSRKCGLSGAMISYYLNGKCKPSVLHKRLIAKAFNMEMTDVFE